MPTDKPRVTFAISEEKLAELESYRYENKIKNQSQAILSLIDKGLSTLESGRDYEQKDAPSTAEAALGDHIPMELSNRFLVSLGLIKEGQDLSDDDLAFLAHIIGLLDTWFEKHK